ncbi:MAG TPA: YcxB family protein [Verrucomicrobiae bacterium]|jgi:hypothetical protein|nr:YcxB family protein [Verrucomicrobiae bacterium]
MAETLRLEYACTGKEMDEAQSLSLREQIGGGSKWLTMVILLAILAAVLCLLYFEVLNDMPRRFRPYAMIGFFALVGFVFWRQRRGAKRPRGANVLEVSTSEVALVVGAVRVTTPWTAFSDCLESPTLFVLVDRLKSSLLVVPKRAFPDERSQNWFRVLAMDRQTPARAPSVHELIPSSGTKSAITLTIRLGHRDYLDRTLASCETWAMVAALWCLFIGVSIYASLHPPPHPVYTSTQVFFMFMLPFMMVMSVFVVVLASFYKWRSHAKYLTPQELGLSEESIHVASQDGSATLPWTAYQCFKETGRSFILWNRRNVWLLLPKRALAPGDNVERCRFLLTRHLRQSRWFFG